MSAFSRALPSARITSHDPQVVQVLSASPAHLARGDFGLKHPFGPSMVAAQTNKLGSFRHIQVQDQDAKDGTGLVWRKREHATMVLKRFQEMNLRLGVPPPSSSKTRDSRLPEQTIISRFDRSSRRTLPTQGSRSTTIQADDVRAEASSSSSDTASDVPNYLLFSEKRFEELLEQIRRNRLAYKEDQLYQAALDRRKVKFQNAKETRSAQIESAEDQMTRGSSSSQLIGPALTLADFPLEIEIEELRQQRVEAEAGIEGMKIDAIDLFNLARSNVNASVLAFVKKILARKELSSRALPFETVTDSKNGASTSAYPVKRLHKFGGLQYSHPDPVSTTLFSTPLPSRPLEGSLRTFGRNRANLSGKEILVGVGSHVGAFVASRKANGNSTVGFDKFGEAEPDRNTGMVKIENAQFTLEPSFKSVNPMWLYGNQARWDSQLEDLGLGYVKLDLHGISDEEKNYLEKARESKLSRERIHQLRIPGTQEWVGKEDGPKIGWKRGSSDMNMMTGKKNVNHSSFSYRDRNIGGTSYNRMGPGASFSAPSGPGGQERSNRVRFGQNSNRFGGGGNNNDGQQRQETVSDILGFGRDDDGRQQGDE